MVGAMRLPSVVYTITDQLRESLITLRLALPHWRAVAKSAPVSGVVLGMTSYPARIRSAWKAVETLLRQDVSGIPVILVLSEDEFPDRVIPRRLRAQRKRGLQVLWTKRNGRSFDKLLPIRQEFPGATIITVDDDKYFPPTLVSELLGAHQKHPNHIIGSRGWRVLPAEDTGAVSFGTGWVRSQPGDKGRGLHVPGGNGCLYPPDSLATIVDDLDLALDLCPTTDDIWFWAAAHLKKTPFYCLGMPPHRPIGSQEDTPALSDVNQHHEQHQFERVLKHCGLLPEDLAWKHETKRTAQ
jgi:hypothetical protein